MKPLVWSQEAEEEFAAAAEWYEGRAEGLGFEFTEAVLETCSRIEESPGVFGSWPERPKMKRAVVRRFPYVLVFEERTGHLNLLAVAHTSRRPGYWAARST